MKHPHLSLSVSLSLPLPPSPFLSQRWLEPEKPLKKQIKGIWLVKAPENSLDFSENCSPLKTRLFVLTCFEMCLSTLWCGRSWTEGVQRKTELSVPSVCVIFNKMTFLCRSCFPLLSELQSTILHFWSQLAAAWADKVCVSLYCVF